MEYALLAALVGVFCVLAVKGVGISAGNLFVAICNAVADATNGSSC